MAWNVIVHVTQSHIIDMNANDMLLLDCNWLAGSSYGIKLQAEVFNATFPANVEWNFIQLDMLSSAAIWAFEK